MTTTTAPAGTASTTPAALPGPHVVSFGSFSRSTAYPMREWARRSVREDHTWRTSAVSRVLTRLVWPA